MARRDDSDGRTQQNDWLRPQSVVFALLAEHLLDRDLALFSGSFIEVLERLGIGEHATRSTLARMTRRGLLRSERHGRKTYFALTPRCTAILSDGRERIWKLGAVDRTDAVEWTLLTFSLPETRRRKRYDLRSRLWWAGFRPLQNGAWLAPRPFDVRPIVAELALEQHVRAFQIRPSPPTDPAAVIRETFELDALAGCYRAFLHAWREPAVRSAPDALTLTLRLSTQWLRILRDDPRVPLRLLPAKWPAVAAQQRFRSLHRQQRTAAKAIARELLDTVEQ
jgi:phenylacetic acid degradation operon negative regulatory protein